MTESEKKSKMMSILEKMLRLAIDPGATEGEKEVAERKASEIMAKYKISSSELSLKESTDPDAGMGANFCTVIDKRANWIIDLAVSLGRVFECRVLLFEAGRGAKNIRIYGEEEDTKLVVDMFNRIQLHISWAAYSELGRNAGVKKVRAFCQGATDRVAYRLVKMYQRMQETNVECRDLMVVKSKKAEDYMYRLHPKTRRKSHTNDSRGNLKEYLAGQVAGDKIDLGSDRRTNIDV